MLKTMPIYIYNAQTNLVQPDGHDLVQGWLLLVVRVERLWLVCGEHLGEPPIRG